ncbi:hypothetical protein PV326_012601 [Microctonus aethiopoides]|nr:hypothetical protein PV326_012601 [Microctonus aethiopoides]
MEFDTSNDLGMRFFPRKTNSNRCCCVYGYTNQPKRQYLKKNAVPSCNLPNAAARGKQELVENNVRRERYLEREKKKSQSDSAIENYMDSISLQSFNQGSVNDTNEHELVECAYPVYKTQSMNLRSKNVMSFMKLKPNVSYAILKALFQYKSISQCRKIILGMINRLHFCLKSAVYFPSKKEIFKNIPLCFAQFTDVSLGLYRNTYSKAEESLLSTSYILSLQKKIMQKNDIKLIRPPFKEDKQFSPEQARMNAEIARARVHIERSNQRLKVFKALRSKMPSGLVAYTDEVMTVITAIY